MSQNQELSNSGHGETDEDPDNLYTTWLREEDGSTDFTLTSEINKKLSKRETRIKSDIIEKTNEQFESETASASDFIKMFDTYDRPPDTNAERTYARTKTYVTGFEDKPGKRLPKIGALAEAGVGRACAEFSVFEAEAKGPNISAGAEANLTGAGAMARAEIASVSAQAGPVGVKLGLGVDTGVSAGMDGFEAKILGSGISVGPKTSISVLGTEVSCSVM